MTGENKISTSVTPEYKHLTAGWQRQYPPPGHWQAHQGVQGVARRELQGVVVLAGVAAQVWEREPGADVPAQPPRLAQQQPGQRG